ncbi:hypothetical protein BGZ83_005423 [Gryganskiella cystojenkinii]|nr:hypothetical protein BGZ83_005423 [Gryganskiella cystojenkinii]
MLREFISIPSITTALVPLLVLVSAVFGPGLLNVPITPYLTITLSLGYLDRLGSWSRAAILPNFYLLACMAVGTGLAYSGMLQSDVWDNSLMTTPFLIGLGASIIYLIPLWIHGVWHRRFLPLERQRFQNDGSLALLGTLVAPSVWVALFTIVYAVSPIGSYGSIAYTQFQIEPLVQWASVAGIAGIEFYMVWASVILHRVWTNYIRLESYGDPKEWNHLDEGISTSTTAASHRHRFAQSKILARRILFAPTPTFVIVTFVISLYGSMRFWNADGTFFMRPLHDTILPTARASCIIGSTESNDMASYMNQTVQYAQQGSEIVIWSETAVLMNNSLMTDQFLNRAKNISSTYGIYLGVTYSQFVDEQMVKSKNMFTLIDNKGQIAFEYQKAHPVAMVETRVIAGPHVLPVTDTVDKFGGIRMGGAICFDMDFQNFIAQAGDKKVDLMLQPSWTWGSIGRLEASIQSFRAVEQGFTLFRCGSWAPSTVWDTYHQLFGYTYNLGSGAFHADIPLRRHVATVYNAVGNLWSYICCFYAIVTLGLILTPKRILDRSLERFEGRGWFIVGSTDNSSIGGSKKSVNAAGPGLTTVNEDADLEQSRTGEESV